MHKGIALLLLLFCSVLSGGQECKVKFAILWTLPGKEIISSRQLQDIPAGFCQTTSREDDTWLFKIGASRAGTVLHIYRGSKLMEFDQLYVVSEVGSGQTDAAVEQAAVAKGLRLIKSLFLPPDLPRDAKCSGTFMVKWYGTTHWGEKVGMSASQLDWWLNKGKRKFAGLCWSGDIPADWVIVMGDVDIHFSYTTSERLITRESGTVTGHVSGTVTESSGDTTTYQGRVSGTYSGTVSGPSVPVTKHVNSTRVAFGVSRGSEYRNVGFEAPSLLTGLEEGKYMSQGPYRKALEKALQFIHKNLHQSK